MRQHVLTSPRRHLIARDPKRTILRAPGRQGPPGPGSTLELTAAEPISASRFVRARSSGGVELAQPDGLPVLGVATNSASPGQTVTIRIQGLHSDPALSLIPGPLFLGADGQAISSPASAWIHRLGDAVTASLVIINPESAMENPL